MNWILIFSDELKNTFTILILLVVLLQNFSKIIIIADFQLHRDYIAKHLCIKKDTVDNCCKGKCYLQKQLNEEDKKEQAPQRKNIKEVNEFQLFFQQRTLFEFISSLSVELLYTPYQCPELIPPSFSIFHPPQCWFQPVFFIPFSYIKSSLILLCLQYRCLKALYIVILSFI